MRNITRLVSAFVLATASLTTANAFDYDILLDASGSMKGFAENSPAWSEFITGLESKSKERYLFGETPYAIEPRPQSLTRASLTQQRTFLGEAVSKWMEQSDPGEMAIVITDNVADTEESTASQQLLNSLLTANNGAALHLGVYATRLPFSGRIYVPGTRNKYKLYNGQRALVVYLIGKQGGSISDFRTLRKHVDQQLRRVKHIYYQLRPFDSQDVSSDITSVAVTRTGSNASSAEINNGMLSILGYKFGEPLKLEFKANVKSASNLTLKEVPLRAAIRFEELPDISKGDVFYAEISPDRPILLPNEVKEFTISFNIDNFEFIDLPLKKQLNYTLQDRQTVDGNLEILFTADRSTYSVNAANNDQWIYSGDVSLLGTPDPDIQSRVYKLDELVTRLIPETKSAQELHRIPIKLEMRYPAGPIFSLLFLISIVLALAYAAYRMIAARRTYLLQDDAGETTDVAVGLFQKFRYYDQDMQHRFDLRYLGVGFLISTRLKILRGSRIVSVGQSFTLIDSESGDELGWRLLFKETASPDDSMDVDEDDFA